MFSKLQGVMQQWLSESLFPESIARQAMGYLTQFAAKASRVGVLGFGFLLVSALSLILTIDHTLNGIWRVRRPRPLAQRVLIYWAAITLGPLLLGASLAFTSYAVSASRGVVGALPGGVQLMLNVFEFFLMAGGVTALYRYVPNTPVKWGHAFVGGLFVSAGIEVAKKLLAVYLDAMPSYSAVYGAFATVPILLIWIYVTWVIVLLGAVIAAYLPSLLAGVARRSSGRGWQFQLAVEVLQSLSRVRHSDRRGLPLRALAQQLRVDALQLAPVLEALTVLDWVGQLSEPETDGEARYVLLADVQTTPLAPLVRMLLLESSDSVASLWENTHMSSLMLRDAL
jgi:membrane protein